MNWNLALKYVGYAFVISVYGVFAWTHRAPVEGFIAVLMGVIATLGSSHVAASAAKAATDAAVQATASAVAPQPVAPVILPTTVVKQ
jgi:hypothetical protein